MTLAGLWMAIAWQASPAGACVPVLVGPDGEPVTNADSALVVVYNGSDTYVTVATDFKGEAASFGYLMAVPQGFSVADAALVAATHLDVLDQATAPRVVRPTCQAGAPTNGVVATGCGVQGFQPGLGFGELDGLPAEQHLVKERRTLGAYDLAVLDPDGADDLDAWLDAEAFVVNAAADAILDTLVAEGVWFLAVQVDASASSAGEGWLEPLRLRFDGRMSSIPLRLGATSSAGIQDLAVTVIDHKAVPARITNYRQVEVEADCLTEDAEATYEAFLTDTVAAGVEGRAAWVREAATPLEVTYDGAAAAVGTHETALALGLEATTEAATVTRFRLRFTPDQIDEDLQIEIDEAAETYVTTFVAYEQELEAYYPVCGEGMVDNPGRCPTGTGPALEGDGAQGGGCATSMPGRVGLAGIVLVALLGRRRRVIG